VGENGIFGFSATSFVYCRNLHCSPTVHVIMLDYQYFSFTRYSILYLALFRVLRQEIILRDDYTLFVLVFKIQSQLIAVQ
jgi:hypothetical protein